MNLPFEDVFAGPRHTALEICAGTCMPFRRSDFAAMWRATQLEIVPRAERA